MHQDPCHDTTTIDPNFLTLSHTISLQCRIACYFSVCCFPCVPPEPQCDWCSLVDNGDLTLLNLCGHAARQYKGSHAGHTEHTARYLITVARSECWRVHTFLCEVPDLLHVVRGHEPTLVATVTIVETVLGGGQAWRQQLRTN